MFKSAFGILRTFLTVTHDASLHTDPYKRVANVDSLNNVFRRNIGSPTLLRTYKRAVSPDSWTFLPPQSGQRQTPLEVSLNLPITICMPTIISQPPSARLPLTPFAPDLQRKPIANAPNTWCVSCLEQALGSATSLLNNSTNMRFSSPHTLSTARQQLTSLNFDDTPKKIREDIGCTRCVLIRAWRNGGRN